MKQGQPGHHLLSAKPMANCSDIAIENDKAGDAAGKSSTPRSQTQSICLQDDDDDGYGINLGDDDDDDALLLLMHSKKNIAGTDKGKSVSKKTASSNKSFSNTKK